MKVKINSDTKRTPLGQIIKRYVYPFMQTPGVAALSARLVLLSILHSLPTDIPINIIKQKCNEANDNR